MFYKNRIILKRLKFLMKNLKNKKPTGKNRFWEIIIKLIYSNLREKKTPLVERDRKEPAHCGLVSGLS